MAYALEKLGTRIKAIRRAKGLSQKQLSDLAGVPQAHISRIESGGVDLRLSSLVAIAHALGHEFAIVPHQLAPGLDAPPHPGPGPGHPSPVPPLGELDYNG